MATTKTKSNSNRKPKSKKKKKSDGAPGWVAPAAIGGGLLVLGMGLFSRRASAKDGTTDQSDGSSTPSDGSNGNGKNNDNKNSDNKNSDNTKPDNQPPADDSDITFPIYSGQAGAAKLEELCKAAGLDSQWVRFFKVTARGESGFTSNVVLGDPTLYPPGSKPSAETDRLGPGEASGARTAYNRGVSEGRYTGCPWPASAYTWGSGGWLGMVPANAWYAYVNTSLRCRHPWYLLHPVDQVVTAIEIGRRLKGWSAFKANPTWLTMRVGWGNPSKMDDPQQHEVIRNKLAPHLKALGIPSSWLDQKVTALPHSNVEQRWESLMASSGMAPGKKGA